MDQEIYKDIEGICSKAKEVSYDLALLTTDQKNAVLNAAADALLSDTERILSENALDLKKAEENQMPVSLQDRLRLTPERIRGMAEGLQEIAALPDPIGEVLHMWKRPNGLLIGQKRVPLGVVGVIYEARPNVTSDVFGLCLKTGNACILKGGSDAIRSNSAITCSLRRAMTENGIPADGLQLIRSTDRAATDALMQMDRYVDVLIPRGGAGLIRSVVKNSTVPVIQTGTGNCHVYVDAGCDMSMALDIIENAKTQRLGVCNACESLVVHRDIEEAFLPLLETRLKAHHVELRADAEAEKYLSHATPATEEDFGTEYLDAILSVKTVRSLDEAIRHINRYNTGHSETIVTRDYEHAEIFLDRVDAACVYVNASTRFTDGHEFGFGAEIGISTQKLHARGPMGLTALTTTKYIILGNGQVRP